MLVAKERYREGGSSTEETLESCLTLVTKQAFLVNPAAFEKLLALPPKKRGRIDADVELERREE